jgi:hypothetical protein
MRWKPLAVWIVMSATPRLSQLICTAMAGAGQHLEVMVDDQAGCKFEQIKQFEHQVLDLCCSGASL